MKTLIVLILFVPLLVFAKEQKLDCNNALTTVDMKRCLGQEYNRLDKQLNAIYKNLQTIPDVDKPVLKIQQRAWMKYRKTACYAYKRNMRTIVSLQIISCYNQMTENRIKELKSQHQHWQ